MATIVVGLAVLFAQGVISVFAANRTHSAVLLTGAVVGLLVALRWPACIWFLALPANFAYWRLGGSGLDFSLADAVLALAFVAALPHVPWRSTTLQVVQRFYAFYSALVIVSVVVNPTRIALISLAQRSVMVVGAVCVGAAIGAKGKVDAALRVLFAASTVVGLAAVQYSFAHDFEAAYPFGMHKNLVGAILSMTLLVAFLTRTECRLPRWILGFMQLAMAAGLVASQARGATLSLVAAIAVAIVRRPSFLRNPLVIGAICVASVVSWAAFQTVEVNTGDRFDSVNSRIITYDATIALWQKQPWVGVGIKFWRDPTYAGQTGFGEPHSMFVSALGETGIVGAVALAGFLSAIGALAWRRRGALWTAVVLVLVARVVEAQFGIFWAANTGSMVWLLLGLAIGDAWREEAQIPLVGAGHERGDTIRTRR